MDGIRAYADKDILDDSSLRETTKEYADEIQERLVDGLWNGYDIDGRPFAKLADSTKAIRKKRGNPSSKPLIDDGNILDFLESDNLMESGKVQVRMKDPPREYMEVQNTAHTIPYSGFAKKYNTIGKDVSYKGTARKWYGVPKTFKEGGTKYNEFARKIIKNIEKELKRSTGGK
tara:strand:- start:1012 stop:1533 length:522 start_codon:yes stop_codon:yes gene_type:complete